MQIVMLCLSGLYLPNWGYQENFMVNECIKEGHNVTVITNSLIMDKKTQKYVPTESGTFHQDGYDVIRLKPKKYGKLTNKIRKFVGLYQELESAHPDILFVHGIQFGDINIVKKYANANKHCYVVCDSHADFGNSAQNILSRVFLHDFYYKRKIQDALEAFQKIYYVAVECKDFMAKHYGITQNMEMLSLGGKCVDDERYIIARQNTRLELKVSDDEILFLHCGKMDKHKKTIETLSAFSASRDSRFKLMLIGSLCEDIEDEVLNLIKADSRIKFLGWKTADEMNNLFMASDYVIQIGGASSSFQQAMCNRCVLVINDRENNKYLIGNNEDTRGFIVNTQQGLSDFFEQVSKNKIESSKIKQNVIKFAEKELDYKMQIRKIVCNYNDYINHLKLKG